MAQKELTLADVLQQNVIFEEERFGQNVGK